MSTPSGVSKGDMGNLGCPLLFVHQAYNVSYTTGVVAPQVVKINYRKIAPSIHLESLSPHLGLPQNSPPLFKCWKHPPDCCRFMLTQW